MTKRPATRAEARELVEDAQAGGPSSTTFVVEELQAASSEFLPLNVRRVLYVVAIAGLAVAPFFQTSAADLALSIQSASSLLGSVALGAALANPTR
ncbi:hypothetical protein [Microbacterium sp. RG1]|uniref:hypothetical protein n=1 Tax=Microbacterium sp. RG1 TaxID=2489212 RepID=UPI0010CA3B46|nr:hypothetical protein [Microbacterium sp. RG1]QCQ16980.1 hypothetical protein EHF32_09760 [Microbacterium sp. RG1]